MECVNKDEVCTTGKILHEMEIWEQDIREGQNGRLDSPLSEGRDWSRFQLFQGGQSYFRARLLPREDLIFNFYFHSGLLSFCLV